MDKKVLKAAILDYSTDAVVEQRVFSDAISVDVLRLSGNEQLYSLDAISEYDFILLWHSMTLNKAVLDRLNNCKAISRIGNGYDNVDIVYAGKLGIPVFNVPDYGTNDVADHTFALLLALTRSIIAYDGKLRKNIVSEWNPHNAVLMYRLKGKKVGIVGLGKIGMSFASRAKAFGMDVAYYDPYKEDGYDKIFNIKRYDSLNDLVASCDIISIHTPLTDETRNMMNDDVLSLCNQAVLINTARGEIVPVDALYSALLSGKVAGFAGDVFFHEPPDSSHPLIQAYINGEEWLEGRFLLTPHAAFYAKETQLEMREKAALNILNFLHYRSLKNCVNKEYLQNLRHP